MKTATNGPAAVRVEQVAEAAFPCRFGEFRIFGFRGSHGAAEQEIVVLQRGELDAPGPAPLVRIQSQCLTGEVFGSRRCDCREQLELSLQKIDEEGRGLLMYDPQEGRGIGLLNKLMAYQLQDEGADTVEANERLGFAADQRDYALITAVLRHFGLQRVRLLSNNPSKVRALEQAGIAVEERVPCQAPPSHLSANYLRTKKEKLGHLF